MLRVGLREEEERLKKVLKVIVALVGVLLIAALGGFGWASLKASSRLSQKFESHRVEIPLPYPLDEKDGEANGGDVAAVAMERAVARGKHLVEARYGCNVCHGANFAGGVMIEDAAIGSLRGPNITSGKGSRAAGYTMADWDRIVRHGIKPDGSPAVMPSEDFFKMTDHELSDVVAFVKSHPPVDVEVPRPTFGPVGKFLLALGRFPVSAESHPNHMASHVERPPEATETAQFGEHIAAICTGCHRPNLAGGPMLFGPPDWPPAANLTPHETGLKSWTFPDFEKVLTTGTKRDGTKVRDPMILIVPAGQKMTPTERKALWAYLTSLRALETNK
jgi:cytochrome c5